MKSLLEKLRTSLERDRELPLARRLSKAFNYGAAMLSAPIHLRACNSVGHGARTRGRPIVENLGTITLGDDVQLNSAFSPVRLYAGPSAEVIVGDRVNINFGASISAATSIRLGSGVSLGPYVEITDHDDDTLEASPPVPIVVGDGVWLAARVRVEKGSAIGAGTVITAGSVVRGALPANVVAGGIPARVLRQRGPAPTSPDVAADIAPAVPVAPPRRVDHRGLLVADFTIQELVHHLRRDDGLGPAVDAIVAPFGQVVQTLHGLADLAAEHRADFALVWTRPEDAVPTFADLLRSESVDLESILAGVDAFADRLLAAAPAVRSLFVATWCLPPFHRGLGMLDMRTGGVAATLMRMNLRLSERLETAPSVVCLNAQKWLEAGGPAAVSAKLWYMGKVGFSHDVFAEAARDVRAALRGIRGDARKLVVVDLDDTLWGGIVGDVGWQNLRLGGHDALGESFVDFQRSLKSLARRGILLAIVSKNEEATALEAIRSHPEMALALEDFAAHRINWRDKALNIVEIANELNLGLQSVVFIDDNPVERARVREALLEVFVPEWPDDKMAYTTALHALRCFDVPSISREDVQRTKLYAAERERAQMKTQLGSIDDWLLSLGTRVRIERLDTSNLPRTTQLLNKTNQMNLRTRRLGEAELLDWARGRGREVWAVYVSDKLGAAGLTGILSLEARDGVVSIVDYVLSCRVMGRKIEETLVWFAVERARSLGSHIVKAIYLETPKNKPCRTFWESASGFARRDGETTFTWDAREPYAKPDCVFVDRERPDLRIAEARNE